MEKKIPIKNYVILVVIFMFTVLGAFYMREWYNTSKEYYAQNSVMTKVVREVKSEELSNYILENPKFVLYVSSGKDSMLKNFEDDLKGLIDKLDINEEMLYLNLDGVDTNQFYGLLRNQFVTNNKIKAQIDDKSVASMYVFEEGKIVTVLNNVNNYSIKRLENIIGKWDFNNA